MEGGVEIMTTQGKVLCSAGVASLMEADGEYRAWIRSCLMRFNRKDWGETGQEERERAEENQGDRPDFRARYNNPKGDIYLSIVWEKTLYKGMRPGYIVKLTKEE